jgi:mannosyltransferase
VTHSGDGQRKDTPVPHASLRFTSYASRLTPTFWVLVALTLVAAALRVYDLGAESYWLDEVHTLRLLARTRRGLLGYFLLLEHGPVYFLLAWGSIALFGSGEAAVRALSALAGIAAIPPLAALGRDLFGRRVGLIAAGLLAISPAAIAQSQNARPYALLLLATLGSYWALLRVLRDGRPRDGVLFAIATLLLVYTHYYALFVLIAQGVVIARRRPWRVAPGAWRRAGAVLSLGLAPLLPVAAWGALRGLRLVNDWLPRPEPWWPLWTIRGILLVPGPLPAGVLLAGLALLLAGFAWRRWRTPTPRPDDATGRALPRAEALLLAGLWAICPIACPLLLSWVVRPLYLDRYTIAAVPALLLLLAVALDAADRLIPPVVATALLAVSIAPGLGAYYARPVNEQWREVAALIAAEGRAGETIILAPAERGGLRSTLTWYYRGPLPTCGIEHTTREPAALATAFAGCADDHTGFWVILRHNADRNADRTAHLAAFFAAGEPPGFVRTGDYPFAVLQVYRYTRR